MYESYKRKVVLCILIVSFLFIIIIPKAAFDGAVGGFKLWYSSVMPGLLPAMIITSCIIYLCDVSNGILCLYAVIVGVFCGFPMGSMMCLQLKNSGINKNFCDDIMAYCNISSPSFIMNYILLQNINGQNKKGIYIVMLLSIYTPILLMCGLTIYKHRKILFSTNKTIINKTFNHNENLGYIIDKSVKNSVRSVIILGGYILLFSCVCKYISLLKLNEIFKSVLCSAFEITNGIHLIHMCDVDFIVKNGMIAAVNSFGGISTIMQTYGIIGQELSLKKYICKKLILTMMTIIVYCFFAYVLM